jgi:hypothetical protein
MISKTMVRVVRVASLGILLSMHPSECFNSCRAWCFHQAHSGVSVLILVSVGTALDENTNITTQCFCTTFVP